MSNFDVIIAIINVLVLVGTLFIATWAYISQRTHNYNSVRPILFLESADFENDIYIRIYNNGVGPAIVVKAEITTTKPNDHDTRKDIIGYFKNFDWEWDDFTVSLERMVISPNSYVSLIEMKNPDNNQRDKLRSTLKDLTVVIRYTDIYERTLEPINERLDWFERDPSQLRARNKDVSLNKSL